MLHLDSVKISSPFRRFWGVSLLAISASSLLSSALLGLPRYAHAVDRGYEDQPAVVVPVPEEKSRFPDTIHQKYEDFDVPFAFQALFSPSVLGGNDLGAGSSSRGASITAEYQPVFLQHFGIVGLGPMVNTYFRVGLVTLFSPGLQVRYQFKYLARQFLVPEVGYSYEHMSYTNLAGNSASLSLAGPVVGAYLLLSGVDKEGANRFYTNTGVSRVYAVIEGRDLTGSNSDFSISGFSAFFGIRVEM